MRCYSFKKNPIFVASFSLATLLSSAHPTQAATEFYVHLGLFETSAQAKTHWEDAKKKYPQLLESLSYIEKPVSLTIENKQFYRAQGGSLADNLSATDICRDITDAGDDCYVVEAASTLMPSTQSTQEEKKQDIAPLPTATSNTPIQRSEVLDQWAHQNLPQSNMSTSVTPQASQRTPHAQSNIDVLFEDAKQSTPTPPAPIPSQTLTPAPEKSSSWWDSFLNLFSSDEDSEAKDTPASPETSLPPQSNMTPDKPAPFSNASSAAGAGRTPHIEIAEAIPVPLSTKEETKIVPTLKPQETTHNFALSSNIEDPENIWAEIGAFSSPDTALQFWQNTGGQIIDLPKDLRIRTIQPLQNTHRKQNIFLRVGPFVHIDAVRNLCGLIDKDKARCRAVKELETSTIIRAKLRSASNLSNQPFLKVDTTSENWQSISNKPSLTKGSWIQLGAFPTPMQAQQLWDKIQKQHSSLFSGVTQDITLPDSSNLQAAKYRLRAGAFGSTLQAITVCEELRRHKTNCAVVPE